MPAELQPDVADQQLLPLPPHRLLRAGRLHRLDPSDRLYQVRVRVRVRFEASADVRRERRCQQQPGRHEQRQDRQHHQRQGGVVGEHEPQVDDDGDHVEQHRYGRAGEQAADALRLAEAGDQVADPHRLEVTRGQAEQVAQELDRHRGVNPAHDVDQQVLAQRRGQHLEGDDPHHRRQDQVQQPHVAMDDDPVHHHLGKERDRQSQRLEDQGAGEHLEEQRPVPAGPAAGSGPAAPAPLRMAPAGRRAPGSAPCRSRPPGTLPASGGGGRRPGPPPAPRAGLSRRRRRSGCRPSGRSPAASPARGRRRWRAPAARGSRSSRRRRRGRAARPPRRERRASSRIALQPVVAAVVLPDHRQAGGAAVVRADLETTGRRRLGRMGAAAPGVAPGRRAPRRVPARAPPAAAGARPARTGSGTPPPACSPAAGNSARSPAKCSRERARVVRSDSATMLAARGRSLSSASSPK